MEALKETAGARSVSFHVETDDPDITAWISQFAEEEWPFRATTAMRVGVLALRQASGFIDREAIRQEGKDLAQAIERSVMRSMGQLVGPESDLLRLLDPKRTDGLVEELRKVVDSELEGTNEAMLEAFDLNKPESALSRLVGHVQAAQKAIRGDFTLDDPESALSRMRDQLRKTLYEHEERNAAFREQVQTILRDMAVRREVEARGTLHGVEFEDAVAQYVLRNAAESNDIGRHTGTTTGIIRNCKVGDCVIELGADSRYAGERIVIEAKEDASYDLKSALEEIDKGRRNRGADVGLFVFSKRTAPASLPLLARHGSDICVVWDADDPTADVCFDAALALARAMVFDKHKGHVAAEVDFAELDRAIEAIAKRADTLEDIQTLAGTIEGHGRKIIAAVETARKDLRRQVDIVRDNVLQARRALANQGA